MAETADILAQTMRMAAEPAGVVDILARSLADPTFWVGYTIVSLFAVNRFKSSRNKFHDFDEFVVLRSFTTPLRYTISVAVYALVFQIVYFALVCISAFPDLQSFFTEYFGAIATNVGISAEGDVEILSGTATPIWAATVTTSLLLALPVIATGDAALRRSLLDFASIPVKARRLASEVLCALGHEAQGGRGPGEAADGLLPEACLPDDPARLHAMFERLDRAHLKILALYRYRNIAIAGESYVETLRKTFLSTCRQAKDEVEALKAQGRDPVADAQNAAELAELSSQLKVMLLDDATFLSCVLLSHERGEARLRAVLRQVGGIEVAPAEFEFTLQHVAIGALCVLIAAVALSFVFGLFAGLGGAGALGQPSSGAVVVWPLVATAMYILPLMLAGGIRLYLQDVAAYSVKGSTLDQVLLAWCLAVIGGFVLAFAPISLLEVIGRRGEQFRFAGTLPWAVAPACATLIFLWRSSRWSEQTEKPIRVFVKDFLIHGGLVAPIAYGAALYAARHGFVSGPSASARLLALYSALSTFFIAGLLGAIQCALSRQAGRPEAVAPGDSDARPGPAALPAPPEIEQAA